MVRAGSARSSSVTKWRATKDLSGSFAYAQDDKTVARQHRNSRRSQFMSGGSFTTALPSIHASKMPCIDPQKPTLFAYPSSASLTLRHLPHQGEGICRRGVLFVSPSFASWHLPHQGKGICRRDGHCPSAKNRCGRRFTSAGQFMCVSTIHARKGNSCPQDNSCAAGAIHDGSAVNSSRSVILRNDGTRG